MKNELYEMELGDTLKMSFWNITRVPGGWIWCWWIRSIENAGALTSCFVPYDSDFDLNAPHNKYANNQKETQ